MSVQNYMLRYLFSISLSILEILISQTKVGNFANKVVIKKNITSCQVTMDYLQKDVTLHFENTNCQKMQFSVCFSEKKNVQIVVYKLGNCKFKGCLQKFVPI